MALISTTRANIVQSSLSQWRVWQLIFESLNWLLNNRASDTCLNILFDEQSGSFKRRRTFGNVANWVPRSVPWGARLWASVSRRHRASVETGDNRHKRRRTDASAESDATPKYERPKNPNSFNKFFPRWVGKKIVWQKRKKRSIAPRPRRREAVWPKQSVRNLRFFPKINQNRWDFLFPKNLFVNYKR